jgi:molybdopterin converting factor small subunit
VSLIESVRRLFEPGEPRIRVHLLVKGRIGAGWYDVDRDVRVPPGATLGDFIDEAERQGIGLKKAIADSPHLRHTLMWNGSRCPVEEHIDRPLTDGDEIYLLAPIAGG